MVQVGTPWSILGMVPGTVGTRADLKVRCLDGPGSNLILLVSLRQIQKAIFLARIEIIFIIRAVTEWSEGVSFTARTQICPSRFFIIQGLVAVVMLKR
jgi:hypothetical protein